MARWKLTESHYLNVLHCEYETKETNRETGRQAITRFKVPRLLDPKDITDFNYRDEGIIVCHVGKGLPRDIEFEGPPTPSMEPLDDEAQAISDAARPGWRDPINEFSAMSHDERLLRGLQEQISRVEAKQDGAPVSRGAVSLKDFEALQAQVAELNDQLRAKSGRRI